jgi:hypothetical protein
LSFVDTKMAPKKTKSLANKRQTKPVCQRKSKRVANAIKNFRSQQKSVKSAAMPKKEAKAQDCIGCRGAFKPNRKKGQKKSAAKNTRQKSKLALNTTKKSPFEAKKVAKFHHHKRPWLRHLLCSISTVGIALSVVSAGSQLYCSLGVVVTKVGSKMTRFMSVHARAKFVVL